MTQRPCSRFAPLRAGFLLPVVFASMCVQASAQVPSGPSPLTPTRVPASRHAAEAERNYLQGAKRLQQGDFAAAESDFAKAIELNPAQPDYTAALLVAREHSVTALLQQASVAKVADPSRAKLLLAEAQRLDGANPRVLQHTVVAVQPAKPVRVERLAGAITLAPNHTLHSYHERAESKALATEIAHDFGLQVAFDPELPSRSLRVDMDGMDAAGAMRILNLLGGTMAVPLDEQTFILASNTTENRQRYERLVQETFYLPGLGPDQLKDFVSIAQQLLDIRQVSLAPLGGALVVRGPADRVDAVERVFTNLLQGTSEMVLDVKLYSVDKNHVRNLGIVLPQSLNAFSIANEAQTIVSQNSALISQLVASGVLPSTATTLQIAAYLVFVAGLGSSSLLQNSFLLLGGGLTTAGLSVGNVPTINLALTQSEARSLEDVQLRASDQQRAVFRSGTRYPIQTSLFSDIASSTATSLAGTTVNGVSLSSLLASYLGTNSVGSSAVVPQVQYEDLGVTVTATPRIQRTGDVTMKVEVKISALSGAALNGIPILDSRQFVSDLTVHDGETVLMISSTSRSETAAITGVPGLNDLPGFQSTTNRNGQQTSSDLVLLMTPHIVRNAHTMAAGPLVPLNSRPGDE